MCMSALHACMSVSRVCLVPKEVLRLHVAAGNGTWVLRNKCS